MDPLEVGSGTGGKATGKGEDLKQKIPGLILHAVEPRESAVLSGGNPSPHRIQGIGAGFIPRILNRGVVDRIVTIEYEEARSAAKQLAEKEGILCGGSSGAILHAALKLSKDLGSGRRVLAILCDTGERYLSTELFS